MDEITPFFQKLSSLATLDEISDDEFELLYFFVVRSYSKTCNTKEVNKARRILFSRDNKVIENIPPTRGALRQHALRSVLQSSKWRKSLRKDFDVRNACQWGWQKVENEMMQLWTNLPRASNVWRELVKCECKKGCAELAKLAAYGFDYESLTLIQSYLSNRQQRTKVNNTYITYSDIIFGVPQGLTLGPLLFNMYICDMLYDTADSRLFEPALVRTSRLFEPFFIPRRYSLTSSTKNPSVIRTFSCSNFRLFEPISEPP